MVHLPALPGSAGARLPLGAIIRRAVAEARQLSTAGFDALIVENFGDAPFAADHVPPETIAAMSLVVDHVVRAVRAPVGVNVLRNDSLAALAVAAAAGAAFIRVNVLSGTYATDQGLITGRPRDLLARREALAPHIKIAADVHVKHATPISQPDIALAAEETAHRAGADVLIVSGAGTGKATDLDEVRQVKRAVGNRPVWIGSGVTPATLRESLTVADGVIVGSALKRGGRTTAELDARRVAAFVRAAR
jgi:membrane complex biogenesis BtpA family protein